MRKSERETQPVRQSQRDSVWVSSRMQGPLPTVYGGVTGAGADAILLQTGKSEAAVEDFLEFMHEWRKDPRCPVMLVGNAP